MYRIYKLERQLAEGLIKPSEFRSRVQQIPLFYHNERFMHSVFISTMHYPLKSALYTLWIPLSSVLLLYVDNTQKAAVALFSIYFIIRMLLGFYESWMLRVTQDKAFTFNFGIWSTGLGTYPYKRNWFIGPAIASLMDIVIYLPFLFLTELDIEILGFQISMISNLALMQTILGTFVRMALNLVAMVELPLFNDAKFIVSARKRKFAALGLFSNNYKKAEKEYSELLCLIENRFEGRSWEEAMLRVDGLKRPAKNIVKKALLRTRYENTIINTIGQNVGV